MIIEKKLEYFYDTYGHKQKRFLTKIEENRQIEKIDDKEYKNVIKNACPGAGACGGMYTANTMASAIEALGMSLPYNSSNPAISKEKVSECAQLGSAIKLLIEKDIKPSDIVTKKFDNDISDSSDEGYINENYNDINNN